MNPWRCARRTTAAVLGLLFLAAAGFHCNDGSTGSGDRPQMPWPERPQGAPAGTELRQQVRLDGRYVKEVRLRPGQARGVGPGEDLMLEFLAVGLQQVKQFEFVLQVEPAEAFDLAQSSFVPEKPFATFGNGIELVDQGKLRIAGALFSRDETVQGDKTLGTLTLKTGPAFSSAVRPRVRVTFFSIGPTSTDRESYADQELRLGLTFE